MEEIGCGGGIYKDLDPLIKEDRGNKTLCRAFAFAGTAQIVKVISRLTADAQRRVMPALGSAVVIDSSSPLVLPTEEACNLLKSNIVIVALDYALHLNRSANVHDEHGSGLDHTGRYERCAHAPAPFAAEVARRVWRYGAGDEGFKRNVSSGSCHGENVMILRSCECDRIADTAAHCAGRNRSDRISHVIRQGKQQSAESFGCAFLLVRMQIEEGDEREQLGCRHWKTISRNLCRGVEVGYARKKGPRHLAKCARKQGTREQALRS